MPVADEVVARAREEDRRAMEAVLADCYPAVYRISHGLIGQARAADRVARFVMQRGLQLMPRWRKGVVPENWFYHHTLLTAREAISRLGPSREDDLLIQSSSDAAYMAFVKAIRQLPVQQMEALILHYGEHFNSRLLGVAMDCSTSAAATHLSAAVESLRTLFGQQLDPLLVMLTKSYAALTPPATAVRSAVHQQAGSVLWRIRWRRFIRRLILLILLAALMWAAYHWRDQLELWIAKLKSHWHH